MQQWGCNQNLPTLPYEVFHTVFNSFTTTSVIRDVEAEGYTSIDNVQPAKQHYPSDPFIDYLRLHIWKGDWSGHCVTLDVATRMVSAKKSRMIVSDVIKLPQCTY